MIDALGTRQLKLHPIQQTALARTIAKYGGQPGDHAAPRILLADDSPANQRMVSMMLETLGCRVDLAANGREAVEMVEQNHYDIVFMDCHMPVMDGYAATVTIRARTVSGGRRLPIIALTATATDRERQKCLEVGMDDYLGKPPELMELEATLGRWVANPARAVAAIAAPSAP